MMRTQTGIALAGLLLCLGCGGGGDSAPVLVDVAITSHHDRDTVSGTIILSGTALGGVAEIAIDDQPYTPVEGTDSWSFEINAEEWHQGWHTVQVRVVAGGSMAVDLVSLYSESGTTSEPTPGPGPTPPPPLPPPTSGLVAHWKLDETSSTVAVDSVGLSHGDVLGGVASVAGMRDGALDFGGVDGRIDITDPYGAAPDTLGDLRQGTIAVWFKVASPTNAGNPAEILPIFYFGAGPGTTAAGAYDGLIIEVGHGRVDDPAHRQIYFTVLKNAQVYFCFYSQASLELDRWYHYAVVMSPTGNQAYLDGEEMTRYFVVGSSETSAFFYDLADREVCKIGHGVFGITGMWWYFNGPVDDVRVYDRPLAAAEVSGLAARDP